MDKYKIDSHKLIYHTDRVNDWLKGKNIYPIYMEVSPSGSCNHRCTYCALDFMEYQPKFLETNILKKRLTEMGKLGVKSIMYAGEGEPFLHKDIIDITNHTKKSGIDVAFTTNGVLLSHKIVDNCLDKISWIKVSINAANKDTYAQIHGTNPKDLEKVISNMSYAAKIRNKNKLKCALGMQILLLPENKNEVVALAKLAKNIGMDYLVVKPYSQHPLSKTKKYQDIKYSSYLSLANKLQKINSDKFNVIFRLNAMEKWDKVTRNYKHCLAIPFWSYIDASGNVWGCSIFLKDERFLYGNIYKNTFKEIWNSNKKKKLLELTEHKLNTDNCRVNCRMDEINRYLWELKNPQSHVNFI